MRLGLVNQVVPAHQVLSTAERYAKMILGNNQRAIRSAKETVFDIIGRSLDDELRLETINGYSNVGDFTEVRQRLEKFFNKRP